MMTAQQIRDMIAEIGTGPYRDGSSVTPGWTYQPIPFPQFADVPCHKPEQVRADFDLVSDHIGDRKINDVVEIGANVGFYTLQLADRSRCLWYAIEGDSRTAEVLRAIVRWRSMNNVTVAQKYVGPDDVLPYADIFLMINVHMWIEKRHWRRGVSRLMKQISHKCDRLYFQTAHASSQGMHVVKWLKDRSDIENHLGLCGFSEIECLGETNHGGRPRYMMTARGRRGKNL